MKERYFISSSCISLYNFFSFLPKDRLIKRNIGPIITATIATDGAK